MLQVSTFSMLLNRHYINILKLYKSVYSEQFSHGFSILSPYILSSSSVFHFAFASVELSDRMPYLSRISSPCPHKLTCLLNCISPRHGKVHVQAAGRMSLSANSIHCWMLAASACEAPRRASEAT